MLAHCTRWTACMKPSPVIFLCVLILSGCASRPPPQFGQLVAWDGLGQDPNRHLRPSTTTRTHLIRSSDSVVKDQTNQLSQLRPFTQEWWKLHDEIERTQDTELARKLVICLRCGIEPADFTASIKH